MQVKLSLLSLGILGALCACSSDESGLASGKQQTFAGDEAYISVRLADAGAPTRATTTDPGYEYGDANEHAVKTAHFYFYDASGVFVAEGSAWNGGKDNESDPAQNIEFTSNNIVALKGLTKKNYPKYMVTVLNKQSDFKHGNTLAEMEKALSSESGTGIITTNNDGSNKYFTMSTTSYKHNPATTNYFVTEVDKEDFFLTEPVPADPSDMKNTVTVYVERLAAKVTLGVDMEAVTFDTIPGRKFYKIKATVAGKPNDIDASEGVNNNQIASEDLYVELLGWKLNATAKSSNIVKNISQDWTQEALGFDWYNQGDCRSFWGMSFNYGKTDSGYPQSATEASSNKYLSYVNLVNPLAIGTSAYCAENTNTAGIVNANFPSAVTSVLLKARVCGKDGKGLDLVRYSGVLFEKAQFIGYILNSMNAQGKLNVYAKTTTADNTVYTQIDKSSIELANVANGMVKMQLTTDASGKEWYALNSDGKTATKIEDNSAIDTNLASASSGAIGYNGGLMYYNIPIEHLNNDRPADGTIAEANYGVVRNHHYNITVNKLEKIGKGIFDPEETIVPDDKDKETYYLGTTINILSWKIVNQSVGL